MKPKLKLVPEGSAGVSPLLRWAGGKRWFVQEFGDDIFSRVIERGGCYIEPFLGGGAMALHLGLDGMILGDAEEELMITYSMIRDNPEQVSLVLEMLERRGTDKYTYYAVRESTPLLATEVAARLIYLNRLCYNGLYRKSKKSGFNVPYDKSKAKGGMPSPERILEISKTLAGTTLHVGDFAGLIDSAGDGDLIYADPPYHETFAKYTEDGFNEDDHERLAESLYHAYERGAEFYAHNADTEMVRYWYDEWAEIIPMAEIRRINSKASGRGEVQCVLIVGRT